MQFLSQNYIELTLVTFFIVLNSNQEKKPIIILADVTDKLLVDLHIPKDSLGLSFGIYINGFENAEKRQSAINLRNEKIKNKNSDYVRLPTFTVGFIGFSKPEKFDSIKKMDVISLKEFAEKDNIKITNPMYIIFKQPNGSYLKWKVSVSNTEE